MLAPQRATGALDLAFKRTGSATRIEKFFQDGCLKTRLPRPADSGVCEAITINISGGIAGGDALTTAVTLAPATNLVICTQAAERIYGALDSASPSRIETTITVADNATLGYLPQETILFDNFALRRRLTIHLAESATFTGVESVIFGRQFSGETILNGTLHDEILLDIAGTKILHDITALSGPITTLLRRPGIAAGAAAIATLLHAAPDAAARLPALRAALPDTAGATCLEGRLLLARILAPDSITLKKFLRAALPACRDAQPLPKPWHS
jgi:urease accessory protein